MSAAFRRSPLLLVPLLALSAHTAAAQFRAGIQGTVLDSTGGALPGVSIVVASSETAITRGDDYQ